jgi:hypothetical protein
MRKCADRPAKQRSPLGRNRPSTREIDQSRMACVNCVVSASRSSQQHLLRRRRLGGLARLASPLPRHAEFLPTRILTGSSLARRGHAYDRFPVAGSKRSIPIAVFSPVGTTKLTALQALQKTGATGLEPATSGVTGVTKPFQRVAPDRRIGQIMRVSAGSADPFLRLVAPRRFHRVSMRARRSPRSCPR